MRYKILERGYFPWPTAKDGVAHLTQAQLSMLVEGIDWAPTSVDFRPWPHGLKAIFYRDILGSTLVLSQQIGYVFGHESTAAGQSGRAIGIARARR
ncbi:IS66 family insertion sequence element accessory protein TnpB [Sinorhizobium meliloti]|uniref:IS66 family insertion sequence element accessory protein TnpB n=1 Tax=Rhizobium meliloti TaxID=382 RepID=UPI0034E49E88